MIVVATNNGISYLPACLDALAEHETSGRKVLVVDTGTTCEDSLAFLNSILDRSWPFALEVARSPYRGYDSGAYIYAYCNYSSADYFFMQDSVRPKRKGWLKEFEDRATYRVGCVPWLTFQMQWDCQEQVDWVRQTFGTDQWPPFGIFGPIFYATREALQSLDDRGYLESIPTTKLEQQAMERGWPTAFILSGYAVRPVEALFDERKLRSDAYADLTKQFAVRS